jgi:hypothetical protein
MESKELKRKQEENQFSIQSYLDKNVKDRNIGDLIHKHIQNLKRMKGETGLSNNEIYFSMIKKHTNLMQKIKGPAQEYSCQGFDQQILEHHQVMPNNCLHIRASFIIWRAKK